MREEERTKKGRPSVEFIVKEDDEEEDEEEEEEEEELTPRCDDLAGSSLGELLDRLDEDIDEVLEMGEGEDVDDGASGTFSHGGTDVVCEEVSPLPLSITSLLSSEESEITKFFTDYGSQPLPDMEMECGTTGSMPNLAGLDVR